jgi:YVTN family beta-propeller protein
MTHKDVGKVTVVDARTYDVIRVLDTGPVTNHVTFAGAGGGTRAGGASAGDFAYVTVCGENVVKAYRRGDLALVATIPVGACPHGVWSSGDGTKVYVGLQEGDGVDVIDALLNRRVTHIAIGQSPQALVYVPNAVPTGTGTEGLVSPATRRPARSIALVAPSRDGAGRATVWIRSLGPVDGVDVSVSGLAPSTTYTLFLRDERDQRSRMDWPLATVATDSSGAATLVEAVAPTTLPDGRVAGDAGRARLVLVRGARAGDPVALVERTP